MSQTVSELLVEVLGKIGVKQISGLIGDSLNPLADALRKSEIEWVASPRLEAVVVTWTPSHLTI